MLILAIGLFAIAGMQITSIKGNFFSNNVIQATILAQDKLEEIKNLHYQNVGSEEYDLIPGTIFSRKYEVVEDQGNSFKTITVTVKWTDKLDHNIVLYTIKSK